MSFAWPWIFVLLPLPLAARRALPHADTHAGAALKVPFFNDLLWLAGAAAGSSPHKHRHWVMWIAWLALISAAARPQSVAEAVTLEMNGRDLVLAVDISGSMEQPDFDVRGRRATRLGVVKTVAGRFLARRKGDRIGLILFGARAYLQTPLTFDTNTVATMLEEAEIGLAGKQTAIGDAIGLALKRMRESEQTDRVLILLTDGANTAGTVSPLRAARLAALEGLRIYTIGIGAERVTVSSLLGTRVINPSADLDETTLKEIARVTGGMYFRAADTQSLKQIYQRLDELEPTSSDDNVFRPVHALYYWPLAVAFALSLALAAPRLFSMRDAKGTRFSHADTGEARAR